MDPVIICIHFSSNQLPFSLSISTAASQIRERLIITPAYFLKLRSCFMQLSLRSQNSGYTLFQHFQDIISHERRDLSFMFKILKIIYCYDIWIDIWHIWKVILAWYGQFWSTILPWRQAKFAFCKSHNSKYKVKSN